MSLRIFLSYQYLGLHPHFKMQDKKKPKPMTLAEYANSLISDMKTLSNTLKPVSKNLYQNNNRILNQVLTGKQQELHKMIELVLSHTLQVAQYKPLVSSVLAILTKTIICLKTLPMDSSQSHSSSISGMISSLVDNLVAVANQNQEVQELSLRVLQITFSLIDHNLVHNFNYSICTRIFSICFEFCTGISIVQNISVSALFALLEAVFQFGVVKESFLVLGDLMMYLFESKKFLWAKGKQMKGLIWDLVVIGVKNFTPNHIIALQSHPECLNLLKKMYEVVTETIFTKKSKQFYSPIPTPQRATSMPITSDIVDFTRFFKAYVSLSMSLSMEAYRVIDKEFIPFRSTIPKLGIVCDLQRNSRMYIFLEAICQLLLNQYDIPLSLEKGIIFMEILSKISEELCWCNETGVKVNWEHGENYLDKHVHEDPKITDGDFVRLIKNTIFQMRMKFEKDQDLITAKKNGKTMETSRSAVLPENLGNSKKWQSFMKNVVRIVRYLSSLNYIIEQSEQDPTRKILLELQYWFLLCPVSKAKNMVLQQLLITANVLNNRMQAVKVSQSVQIGSNILYGYYDDLDSMGLTIVLKMMAGIKADWEEGKSFQELDEIYNLVNNIYNEHHLIAGEASFLMTIQALVQCTNSLIADIEQPKDKQPNSQGLTHPIKRIHKMIQFLLQKLILVINNHLNLAAMQWNFITGFLITLCICKNFKIKEDGVKAIGALVTQLLKTELGKEIDEKKETDIMGLYEELAKSKMQKIMELTIIDQLKLIMPRIQQQVALMDCFRIVKILSDAQNKNPDVIASIHELQEILVKDCLFRITDLKYLRLIVDGMQIKVSEKNQEYRLINLLWAISDYFRSITPKDNIPNDYIELWEALFKNIWSICETSQQCQTKQSAIHCTTQILAEVLNQLPFDFIMLIISKYYHEMVLLLLGIHDSSLQESEKSSETAKVGLKNYIKLFKKLISIGQKSEQSKKQIQKNFSSINISIIKYLNHTVESQKTGPITLELLFELCNFILIVSEDVGFQEYGVTNAMRDMFMAIDDIIKLTQRNSDSGILNPKMDLKSHMFKKKLKPLLDKISDRQKKEKVVLTEISNKLES